MKPTNLPSIVSLIFFSCWLSSPLFSCSLSLFFFFDPSSSISFAISTTQRPIYYYIPLSSSLSFKPGHMASGRADTDGDDGGGGECDGAKSIHQIGLMAISSPASPTQIVCGFTWKSVSLNVLWFHYDDCQTQFSKSVKWVFSSPLFFFFVVEQMTEQAHPTALTPLDSLIRLHVPPRRNREGKVEGRRTPGGFCGEQIKIKRHESWLRVVCCSAASADSKSDGERIIFHRQVASQKDKAKKKANLTTITVAVGNYLLPLTTKGENNKFPGVGEGANRGGK